MAKHLSIRLAWHENGWNGHICQHPCGNNYCIGSHSYPGSAVAENRDVEYEKEHAGEAISNHPCKIACSLSANAFGSDTIRTLVKKPSWWKPNDADDLELEIPPYTACTWPYDAAYNDDVYQDDNSERYDNDKRLENARRYFNLFECGKSLVFYYAGYSNPFSKEDDDNFVIVGVSRLKQMHDFLYYGNPTDDICKRYANGIVWQKPITSCYPDEGLRIPYWKYADDEDVLERLVVKPTNREPFKYASREVPADDAIDVINQLIGVVDTLIELNDDTEDWATRRSWLVSVLNELWTARGPYPGLPSVLEFLELSNLESSYLNLTSFDEMKKFYKEFVDMMNSERDAVIGVVDQKIKEARRKFELLGDDDDDSDDVQKLLIERLPRFDLTKEQVAHIVENRTKYSITSSFKDLFENPYEIFEQYRSAIIGDEISFYKIDNGVLTSPQYGIDNLMIVDATERLRALCVDELNRIPAHSFGKAKTILENINIRLDRMPEWKRASYKQRHFSVDKNVWKKAIHQRKEDDVLYLYLKDVYEDERTIEEVFRTLADREDISLRMTITKEKFKEKLKKSDSDIEESAAEEYENVIDSQADVCMQIFSKSISVLSGSAGTGKTTVIQALLENIKRVHGSATNFLLMAPTGKAAERIKNQTGRPSMTIHSFLAKNGWINDNYTFKKAGGVKAEDVNTLIIDECSMIDLNLFATLVRAINWSSIQRLILVGDSNQLPAIGRGRVFADTIEWLKNEYPQNVGVLKENVRQLVNRIKGNGNGILDLANVFIQERQKNFENSDESVALKTEKERIFNKILLNGNGDVDKDLGVYFWKNQDDLEPLLKKTLIDDMQKISGTKTDGTPNSLNKLWRDTLKGVEAYSQIPEKIQLISPYRGEFYGTAAINTLMQSTFNNYCSSRLLIDGISVYDKVIQKINRPKSNKASAYSFADHANIGAEIYNGEIGVSQPHSFEMKNWMYVHPKRIQVKFSNESRKNFLYNYGQLELKDKDGKWIPKQDIEENLELAYAISVHKSQGSEFDYVYIVIPKRDSHLLSMELLYTALTRAQKKVTLFLQEDIGTLTSLGHVEKSAVRKINSSVFNFDPLPEELLYTKNWYKENKKLATLSDYFVRSKSEVIIANLLAKNEIPFEYETPLYASDGTFYLPDFTVKFRGETYYWEHWGRMDLPDYRAHTEEKQKWYAKHFPGKLIETYEDNNLTPIVEQLIKDHIKPVGNF